MVSTSSPQLEKRVSRAADATLARQPYVSAIDVLCGMGLLASVHVESWRKGRIAFLEEVIQGNPRKISSSLEIFQRWAEAKQLRPSVIAYARATREGSVPLHFSKSRDAIVEKIYSTHYISPELGEQKSQKLQEKLEKPPQPVVFQVLRDSECSECGAEIAQGSFLFKEGELALCLACSHFDDLEYLMSGDATLTRRASKYTRRLVLVVRFSRSRGRYERQGILVETSAIEKAERECLEDADERATARVRATERRHEEDQIFVIRMAKEIGNLFPGCPPSEVLAIAERTAVRGSGRVGRTEGGRNLEERALTLAVAAAIRHNHTEYDELLLSGVDRETAREQIRGEVEEILATWRGHAPRA